METKVINKKVQRHDGRSTTFFVKYDGNNVDYIGTENRVAKCGEIWMGKLPDKEGSVQGGYRPLLVISNDKNNMYSTVLNVIPLTTKMNKRNLPCHVEIWDYKKYGLSAPSTIMVEQVTTIRKGDLKYKMGEIKDIDMLMRICRAMEIQFPVLNF